MDLIKNYILQGKAKYERVSLGIDGGQSILVCPNAAFIIITSLNIQLFDDYNDRNNNSSIYNLKIEDNKNTFNFTFKSLKSKTTIDETEQVINYSGGNINFENLFCVFNSDIRFITTRYPGPAVVSQQIQAAPTTTPFKGVPTDYGRTGTPNISTNNAQIFNLTSKTANVNTGNKYLKIQEIDPLIIANNDLINIPAEALTALQTDFNDQFTYNIYNIGYYIINENLPLIL
jgi:hypothetical protein